MTLPPHFPSFHDLCQVGHERLPVHGETEHGYFERMAAEFRVHERSGRRLRMIAAVRRVARLRQSADVDVLEQSEHRGALT
jgi:hypothetical protein